MFLEFGWEPLDVIGGWLGFGEPFDLPDKRALLTPWNRSRLRARIPRVRRCW